MVLALANYTDLQATALAFMERTGVTADTDAIAVNIKLAEARLNRELGPVETDQAFTGVISSRVLDISALTIVEPIRLWYTPASAVNEVELEQVPSANFAMSNNNGPPVAWMMHNQSEIRLNCPVADTYTFRFRYRGPFALSASSTNWLLTNHPDTYLAATLVWGGAFNQNWPAAAPWASILETELPKVKHTLAQTQRGTLRPDAALMGRRRAYNINSDS